MALTMKVAQFVGRSIVVSLVFAALSAMAAAQPVAIVTDIQGTASYANANAGPLAILSPLNIGDRVRLSAGARLVMLFYADGAQFEARGPGNVLLEAGRPKSPDGAVVKPQVMATSSGVRLKSGGLVQGAVVMRSLGLRVVAPDALVLPEGLELAWTDSRSEASYDVVLFDTAGSRVFEATTSVRSVTLPESVQLATDQSYALQVSARLHGTLVQTARAEFTVASEALRAQAQALAPKTHDAPVAEKVAYALWLDQNDLRDEARKWWSALAQARPEQGGLRERAGVH
jgi:hypothetical protein